MTIKQCPACGGAFKQGFTPWHLVCLSCGLEASSLAPDIPAQKGESPIDEEVREKGLRAARTATNAAILNEISHHLAEGQSILDVGCGPGFLLAQAAERGFMASGVEPDANVVESARRKANGQVHSGFFPQALPAGATYDCIVFNDVLEHIPDLDPVFAGVHEHLRPGGILVLNSPDRRGIFYRLSKVLAQIGKLGPFERMWQLGLPSPHVWYFTARDIERLAERAGLEPFKTLRLSPVSAEGLRERISYVSNQSRAMNTAAFVVARSLVPFLGLLPKDTSAVFIRKPTS